MALIPDVRFETTARGVKIVSLRRPDDASVHRRITEAVVPTLRVVPSPRVERYGKVQSIGWVPPIDDTTFRIYTAASRSFAAFSSSSSGPSPKAAIPPASATPMCASRPATTWRTRARSPER